MQEGDVRVFVALDASLALQAIVALFTGGVYAYVARLVLKRSPSEDARLANMAFAVWWAAFGALEFFIGAYQLPSALGFRDLATAITLINVIFILLIVALWGLVYYLIYLYTGSTRALWPITLGYTVLGLGLLYFIAWADFYFDAAGVLQAHNKLGGAGTILFGLLFSVPVVLAAIGYGSLYFRAEGRSQRFRVAVVSGSFLAWFGWSGISTIFSLNQKFNNAGRAYVLTIINSTISIVVPILIVLAFDPPAWLRAKLRLHAAPDA